MPGVSGGTQEPAEAVALGEWVALEEAAAWAEAVAPEEPKMPVRAANARARPCAAALLAAPQARSVAPTRRAAPRSDPSARYRSAAYARRSQVRDRDHPRGSTSTRDFEPDRDPDRRTLERISMCTVCQDVLRRPCVETL
jgi:hypothetical protein